MPVGKTLYNAGTKKTVQGYSKYNGDLYMAGTAVNKIGYAHSSGTLYYGNGSSGYLRGGSVSARYGYYTYQGALYDADGERVNRNQTFFYGGSSGTLYYGNGGYVTGRGSAVDAIEWNGTLYEKGSSVTPISTKVSGLYRADDEENWTYTPIGTGVSDLYQRNAEDDEKVETVGTACSLKLATLTTRDVTALTT